MKFFIQIYLCFVLFLLFGYCKQAKFDNPLEGAGGLIIGTKQRTGNSVLVTNFPSSIDEEASITFQVKLSQKIDSDKILTVSPENSLLKVTTPSSGKLTYTPENYNIDQNVIITLSPSDKVTPIDIGILLQPEGISGTRLVISGNYKFSRKIDFSGPTSLAEETTGILKAKLRKQPQANTTVTLASSAAVTISPNTLSFTPSNFAAEQSFSVTINDIYNDNRTYTITGTSESESTSYSLSVVDNDYAIVDISTAIGNVNNSGKQPSIAIDTVNNRFFVVTRNSSTGGGARPLIHRCDSLNGTNCNSYVTKTSTITPNSGYNPNAVYDSTNQNLFFITNDLNISKARFMKIDGDMTGTIDCSANTSTCNLPFTAGGANVFNVLTSPTKIALVRYNPQYPFTQECDRTNISVCTGEVTTLPSYSGQSLAGIGARAFKYDSTTSQLFGAVTGDKTIGSTVYSFIPKGIILVANGTTGTVNDVPVGNSNPTANFGYTPDMEIDSINNRLIISTFDYSTQGGGAGRPGLVFCDKTMTSCSYQSMPGTLYPSYHPKLLWDSVNQKIQIITYNASKKPYLHHCDQTGSSCTEFDLSKGQSYTMTEPESSGYNFDAVIDTVNNRTLLVFAEGTTGKLILLRYGLGGF